VKRRSKKKAEQTGARDPRLYTFAAAGLADRVSVQPGDYFTDDIGQGYDVILLFLINHDHTEEENRQLLAKVAQALNPGGMVVIHEFLRREPPEVFDALFSLLEFACTRNRCYRYQEITGWLREAGFSNFNCTDLPPTGYQSSIVTAVKNG
jgi:cyclopropane fatty-acyl-phospholipid synthase-like methyltransferase